MSMKQAPVTARVCKFSCLRDCSCKPGLGSPLIKAIRSSSLMSGVSPISRPKQKYSAVIDQMLKPNFHKLISDRLRHVFFVVSSIQHSCSPAQCAGEIIVPRQMSARRFAFGMPGKKCFLSRFCNERTFPLTPGGRRQDHESVGCLNSLRRPACSDLTVP